MGRFASGLGSAAVLGIDLAWGEGDGRRPPNETGVVAADRNGRIVDAGWTRGVEATVEWMAAWAGDAAVAMVDAPLVVENATGMRECEREVGRRYGRWKVSANCSNLGMAALGGVSLVRRAAVDGWRCADGQDGPPSSGRHLYEVYPYTTLVGAPELGYGEVRPVYKRRPNRLSPDEFRAARATVCDDLVRRLVDLRDADPPIDLTGHPVTAALVSEPTPLVDRQAKHREDLIDAVLCAWTGLLWLRYGLERCQILGTDATILAPARPEQRR